MKAWDHPRGWCPSMLVPMPTGDGLLVRLHPLLGRLTTPQMRAIATAADRFGNGLIDLSSRGNLQIRGVGESAHADLVQHIVEAGLTDGIRSESPFRLTITSPFAGIDRTDLIDARHLAEQVEQACAALPKLSAKMCVVIDGGGSTPLDDTDGDIRLVAVSDAAVAIGLMHADGPQWVGTVSVGDAPASVRTILARFASIANERPGEIRRMRDLPATRFKELAENLDPPVVPPDRRDAPRVGIVSSAGQTAVLLGLPYGRCTAAVFDHIASWSEEAGLHEVRLSPWRSIALSGLSVEDAAAISTRATAAGMIVDPHDTRRQIAACPGAPACTSGTTSTHDDADRIATALRQSPNPTLTVHVSGCAKGCAHPGNAALTLVAQSGTYGIVADGNARTRPDGSVSIDGVIARLTQTSPSTTHSKKIS